MPDSGERAYAYAKACGIIGKSFVGKRISGLGTVTRLQELDRLLFPQSFRELPERELLVDLERRIIDRAAQQIMTIVNSFKNPPEFLIRLLRSYEYGDLKSSISAMEGKEIKAPAFTELGRFRTVRFEAYPDLKAMIKDTEFEALLKEAAPGNETGPASLAFQARLDFHYYESLRKALLRLPKNDRQGIAVILAEEDRKSVVEGKSV
jgi:hypothetical protein